MVRDGVCGPVVWRLCTSSAAVHHRLPRRQCMVLKYCTSPHLGPSTAPYDCINIYACIRVNFLHVGADDAALGAIFHNHRSTSAELWASLRPIPAFTSHPHPSEMILMMRSVIWHYCTRDYWSNVSQCRYHEDNSISLGGRIGGSSVFFSP